MSKTINWKKWQTSSTVKSVNQQWTHPSKHSSTKSWKKCKHRSPLTKWNEWLPCKTTAISLNSYKKISILKIKTPNKRWINLIKNLRQLYQPKCFKLKNIKYTKSCLSSRTSPMNSPGKMVNLFSSEKLIWEKRKKWNSKSSDWRMKWRNSTASKAVSRKWKMSQTYSKDLILTWSVKLLMKSSSTKNRLENFRKNSWIWKCWQRTIPKGCQIRCLKWMLGRTVSWFKRFLRSTWATWTSREG